MDDMRLPHETEKTYREIEELWNKYIIEQGLDPLELAGIFTAIAMKSYKANLSPEDFDAIMEEIYVTKDYTVGMKGPTKH